MEILRRLAGRASASRVVSTVLVVALAGCVLLDSLKSEPPKYAFSHRVHVDEGLGCTDCHRQVETAEDPGMPAFASCQLCHAELDAEKPPERQVRALYDDTLFRAAHALALSDELVFSHQTHVASGTECATCHTGIEKNEYVGELPKPSMDGCMACHQTTQVSNACATCHATIRADVPPASHETNWRRTHGAVVREHSERTSDRCALCHKGEASCTACHLEEAPANHSNYFRQRGHGIVASMDRESCAVCHRTDSCERCHSETLPMSHTGGWGAPTDRHCLSCHTPLRGESCAVCHKGTPSHALAPPKPPDHNPAMNCRMCHGAGQPLPHVDNGSDCNACHM